MRARMMWMLVIAVAVGTAAACGDSKSSLLPTAPSALSDAASVDASAANAGYTTTGGPKPGNGNGNNNNNGGGNGNGNGNGNGRAPSNTSPAPTSPVPPGKAKVEFEGLLEYASATSIKVNGQTVNLTLETVIRHGNREIPAMNLSQGDRVHVRANRVVASGASAANAETTLEATLILVQKQGDAVVDPFPVLEPDVLVSVTASDNSANESGAAGTNTGTFRLTRTGTATQLANALTVSFSLSGSATAGDYLALPASVSFAANSATADVTVTPVNDYTAEPMETVVLTVTPASGYELGSPASAAVNLFDDPLPTVSVVATDPNASEAPDRGRFVVSRFGNLAVSLQVTITLTGTAENGVDYPALPTTLSFGPGESMLTLNLFPIADAVLEGNETVILTVVDGDLYDLGASSVAVMTIVNVGGS